jgi:hypothetical protein
VEHPGPPLSPPPYPQQVIDADHLRLLSIFQYVMAGITALYGLFPIFHIGLGALMVSGKSGFPVGAPGHEGFPPEMGWLFIVFGIVFILIAESFAVMWFLSARWITARKNLTFILIAAGFECLHIPFGTAVGVFSFVVLQRPSVRALFEARRQAT